MLPQSDACHNNWLGAGDANCWGFIKMHLKGVCSQVKLPFRLSLSLSFFFLSTSLKLPALLEEVRHSPSFVEEDFRLLWKIARHLELSERVRDLSFNFPLSSLACCTTPSTSQCWCLACLYACCLFVYLFFFSIKQNGVFSLELGPCLQDIWIIFHASLSCMSRTCCCYWIQISCSIDFSSLGLFGDEINVTCVRWKSLPAGKSFVLQLELPREY